MKLFLKRIIKEDKYTIGELYVDGKFFCHTIEDKVRVLPLTCPDTPKFKPCACKEKVYTETAIPAGTYKVTLDVSPKFGRVFPRINDVPHFIGILIHAGNTEKDSAGCVIVGRWEKGGLVTQSRVTLEVLMKQLEGQKDITIEIE